MTPNAQFEHDHVRMRSGRTLIVGSHVYPGREDRRTLYPDVLGVDMVDGPGVDYVLDMEKPLPKLGWFDHVECLSVLEHSRQPWLMAANIERLLLPGGTLYVAVPFCWRLHAYPSDYWRFTPEGIRALFPGIEWLAVKLASDELFDGPKIKSVKVEDHPYFPRTETLAFGVKR